VGFHQRNISFIFFIKGLQQHGIVQQALIVFPNPPRWAGCEITLQILSFGAKAIWH